MKSESNERERNRIPLRIRVNRVRKADLRQAVLERAESHRRRLCRCRCTTTSLAKTLDNPSRHSFGQQRLVPFIYADITDHIKFAAELEFERGGPNAPQGTDGSMSVEFAQLDYLVE